jgi:hypothetical protein
VDWGLNGVLEEGFEEVGFLGADDDHVLGVVREGLGEEPLDGEEHDP